KLAKRIPPTFLGSKELLPKKKGFLVVRLAELPPWFCLDGRGVDLYNENENHLHYYWRLDEPPKDDFSGGFSDPGGLARRLRGRAGRRSRLPAGAAQGAGGRIIPGRYRPAGGGGPPAGRGVDPQRVGSACFSTRPAGRGEG